MMNCENHIRRFILNIKIRISYFGMALDKFGIIRIASYDRPQV